MNVPDIGRSILPEDAEGWVLGPGTGAGAGAGVGLLIAIGAQKKELLTQL